jgi:LysM repeat protein
LPAEHVVSQGDTFYSLAKRWGVSIKRLQAANPKVKPQALRAGMKLQVPHP